MEYIQALIIGLVGSFHCAGMCGPIALALPLKDHNWITRITSALLYNLGRICTYGILGFLFGFLGYGLAFWGLQKWISIAVGSIMIISVVFPLIFRRMNLQLLIDKSFYQFKKLFGQLFRYRSYTSTFTVGLLNGFLPCGLVYIALAGAVVMNGATEGALYMLLFGFGTLPMLLFVSIAGNIISAKLRSQIRKLIPIIIIVIGILFVLRGLDLGIPYISPKLAPSEQVPDCCK